MQRFKQMPSHAIFIPLLIWLALVCSSLPTQANASGTVISLQWFTSDVTFTIRVKIPRNQPGEIKEHRLLVPTLYNGVAHIQKLKSIGGHSFYNIIPNNDMGQMQLFIPTECVGAVVISPPKKRNTNELVALTAYSTQNWVEYTHRYISTSNKISNSTEYFRSDIAKEDIKTATTFISFHGESIKTLNTASIEVDVYPSYTDSAVADMQPVERSPLSKYIVQSHQEPLSEEIDVLSIEEPTQLDTETKSAAPNEKATNILPNDRTTPMDVNTDYEANILEDALHSRMQSDNNYFQELGSFLAHVMKSNGGYFLGQHEETQTGSFSFTRPIHSFTDTIQTDIPEYTLSLQWNVGKEHLKKLHQGIATAITSTNQLRLPLLHSYHEVWTGQHMLMAISKIDMNAVPLSIYITSSPIQLNIITEFLRSTLEGLQKLYSDGIYPSSILKNNIHVTSGVDLSPPLTVLFGAPPWRDSPASELPVFPSPKLIRKHLESIVILLVEMRTGQPSLLPEADNNTAMEEWRKNPKTLWASWLNDANLVPVDAELDLIEEMATEEPNKQTLNTLIRLCDTLTAVTGATSLTTNTVTLAATSATWLQLSAHQKPPEVYDAPDKYCLQCPKGHPLELMDTHMLKSIYSDNNGREMTVGCDHPGCKDSKKTDLGKEVTDECVMHCEQCGYGAKTYDLCMARCARQLEIPGFPRQIQCNKKHNMTFVKGIRKSPPPANSDAFCDGPTCEANHPNRNIRNSHHYTCKQCYRDDKAENKSTVGFDLCTDCAIERALLAAKPKGHHHHELTAVVTQPPGRICSTCCKENPVGQYHFTCPSCLYTPSSYYMCKECAAQELNWYGAGLPHTNDVKY